MIRLGVGPRLLDFARGVPGVIDSWFNQVTSRFGIQYKAGAFTVAEVPKDQWGIFKNTTAGTMTLTVNDNGTLKSVDIPNTAVFPATVAPLMDGVAAVGTSLLYARQDHVHPTDTSRAPLASPAFTGVPTAPTAAVDTSTTQLATTAFVINQGYLKITTAAATYAPLASPALTGVPTAPTAAVDTSTTQIATTAFVTGQAASVAPLMDSVAAVGTSLRYARQDHVHASDTSKANLASPTFTGVPAAPTAAADTSTTQLATTAYVVGQASSTLPVVDGTATIGTSLRYARGDHIHPTDTSRAPTASPTFTGTATIPTAVITTLNGGQLAGMRNKLINGNMMISQRGTSFTGPSGYTVDRWYTQRAGGVTGFTIGQFAGGSGGAYGSTKSSMTVTRTAGNASTATFSMYQSIEGPDCFDLGSSTATLSFQIGTGANLSSTTGHSVNIYYRTSAGADLGPTSIASFTGIGAQSFTLVSAASFVSKSFQFSIPSGVTQLMVQINIAYAGVAGADDTVYITEVQLESGTVATSFEHRPYAVELAMCQRFYNALYFQATGWANSATQANCGVMYPAMRTTPTATWVASSGSVDYGPGGTGAISSMNTPNYLGTTSFRAGFNMPGGMTTNDSVIIYGQVTLNAELT